MKLITMLEDIAAKENISNVKMENFSEHTKGRGYMGDISTVRVTGNGENGENVVLNVVIKSASTHDEVREMVDMDKVYGREIFMYDTVIPAFYAFEKRRGIANPVSGELIPKCYGILKTPKQEALIFEDLKNKGYEGWDRTKEMDDEHVRMVFSEYGRLHAISFAMKDQDAKLFQKLANNIDNIYDIFLERTKIFNNFADAVRKAEASLDPVRDKAVMNIYKTFSGDVERIFKQLLSSSEEHQIILHGDSWCNNLMFKYEDINKTTPIAMRLFDFQLTRMASPVCDLVFFFYTCCAKETLDNLDTYMNIYYESLSIHLNKLGSKPEKVYPLSTFIEHWMKYARLGLIQATFCKYLLLSDDNEAISFNEIADSGKTLDEGFKYEIANVKLYNERIRNVILHCARNHFI